MRKYFGVFTLLLTLTMIITSCGSPTEAAAPGMANPASVFCKENGGVNETRGGQGGQYGVCKFNDGSECGDWTYFRGECKPGDMKIAPEPTASSEIANPASVFCQENGGINETREGEGGQYGVCKFNDGSECGDWAYFRGECKPGDMKLVPPPGSVTETTEPTEVSGTAYQNEDYGFSLTYPEGWIVEEGDHTVIFKNSGYQLFIGYFRDGEERPIFRTGMPAGDFVEAGNIPFLNNDASTGLTKQNLVWNGKIKVVTYASNHKAGDLNLFIWLDPIPGESQPYEDIDIPETIRAQADQIITSFAIN